MTSTDLAQLLQRSEAETLDFKADGYDLQKDRNAFIKDLLAMANTPRQEDAVIVLGVHWTPEDGSRVIGLSRHLDDAEFQRALADRVQPRPRFIYEPHLYEGQKLGVLRVPIGDEGPYTAVKDYADLQAGVIYYRRGTSNERAIGVELKRIVNWFLGRISPPLAEAETNAWRSFYDSVYRFAPDRLFVLALDPVNVDTAAPLHALAMVPWRAVIDFDPSSEVSGILSAIGATLEKKRVIHRVVKGQYRVDADPGTHWFFARGLAGRLDTIAEGDHRSWLRAYKQELSKQLERLAAALSPSPISVVVVWTSRELRRHLRTLVEEFHGAFGDLAEIVMVSSDRASFEELCEEAGVSFTQINLRNLLSGIAVHFADRDNLDGDRSVLPTSAGAPIEIEPRHRLWLAEDLQVAYRGLGLQGDDSAEEYRRGGELGWRNLQLRHDCDRDLTPALRAQVETDLRSRQTLRINLYHAPGAGGTTVGRRVLWDLRDAFPAAILRRCSPRITAERIAKIAALTEHSVLVLVDGGEHSERDIDDLYDFLRAGQTPCVLLQTLRRFQRQQSGRRQFWLDAELSDGEADRFRSAYASAAVTRNQILADLSEKRSSQRTAFFFGLSAFGKDFRGLDPYVQRRIQGLSEDQRRILAYISLAHYYGQHPIPAQAFAGLLKLPRSRSLELPVAFRDPAAPALDLLVESGAGEWRSAHHVIALAILERVLAPVGSKEPDKVWRQSLSSWAKSFADFCRGDDQTPSDRLLELARRVFIYRDNVELLGTERAYQSRFGQLIEDIPSIQGQSEVLKHLTDRFPLEAHFHAHLGRFLAVNGDLTRSLKSVDFAISLQPDDPVLHHVRGMVLRYEIRRRQEAGAAVQEIVELAQDATGSFGEARRLAPDLEHGYISEVQLLISVLDYAGRGEQKTVATILAGPGSDPFLRRAVDQAEDLLDRVQHLYAGEEPSRYVVDCRARLQRLYGDYQTALQAWDNLLARQEVAKPVIRRQIVWTLLRRRDGAWVALQRKELERIRRLLEENLQEEVNDSTSLRLWLRAIRQSSSPPSLDSVIEKVSYWKANTGSLDAAYYLYVLHAIRGLEGSSQAMADAEGALEQCRSLARFRRDRTRSFEWIGGGQGIQRLVHQSQLGDWKDDFWNSSNALVRLTGRVASIDAPQKGSIELSGGMDAFFVPAKAGLHYGRDENTLVTCYLGFSYDGPRAWNVQRVASS